jgi:TonB family protein
MKTPLLLVLVMACGGKAPPPASTEPVISAKATTRVPVEDDENEDGVQILNARGHMDPKAVEAGIAPHAQALTECYTTQLHKRRWLGGHVVLHWEIKRDGTVTAVRLAESDLGAWPIEKCLLDVARMAEFGPPINGDADFQLPLDFTAKGKLISWDDDQALRAVGGQLVKLDACATKKVPAPSGVIVTLYVGPGGKAQSVGFAGSTVIDDAWAECAAKAALALRLPDPRGQIAKLAVKYRTE